MMKLWLLPTALALAGAAHGAENCEALRAQIEAKIGASGVARFAVFVLDANEPASGQVVGSCELGTKKVVYQREVGSSPAPAPENERILTECKDGTVSVGGNCR